MSLAPLLGVLPHGHHAVSREGPPRIHRLLRDSRARRHCPGEGEWARCVSTTACCCMASPCTARCSLCARPASFPIPGLVPLGVYGAALPTHSSCRIGLASRTADRRVQ